MRNREVKKKMNLNYNLPNQYQEQMNLNPKEQIWYCAPTDLSLTSMFVQDSYLVVTSERIITVTKEGKQKDIPLNECSKIKCERFVDNGIFVVTRQNQDELVARFSMKHMARLSYIARGATLLSQGRNERVESDEPEKFCETCGRALPGTKECPHCNGSSVTWNNFWALCKPYKGRLFIVAIFMLISCTGSLLMPEVQQTFIDGVLVNKSGDMSDVAKFIITMLLLTVMVIVVNIIKNWYCVSLGAKISMDLRAKLYYKIQILSLSFLNKRKPGELMNRVVSDTAQIRNFMERTFATILSSVFTMIGTLTIMILMDPFLTFLALIFFCVVLIITRLFFKKAHRIDVRQWRKGDRLNSGLQDVISGMRVVKSFGKEEMESKRFFKKAQDHAKAQQTVELFWAACFPMITFIMGSGIYLVTYFGGVNVLEGRTSVGQLIQFMAYMGILYGPLQYLTQFPRLVTQLVTSLERVYDVLDEQPEIINHRGSKKIEIKGNVTFEDVSFGYETYEPILEQINLEVAQGEMIGLVGSSGSGKSTLINLLMRLYDANYGALKIDGVDIKDIQMSCLHSQIGVVLQETFLFSGTILNNIRFARPDAMLEEVIHVARVANAHDFITKLPDGYNTYVGEKGANLSGGERQRIAIARALLNDPKLLILDEATSALDTESEYLIQQALNRLVKGRTTFAIAHRLSTLREANRLVVMDGRTIAEVGTHNELLLKKGIYYGLVKAQLEMQKVNK